MPKDPGPYFGDWPNALADAVEDIDTDPGWLVVMAGLGFFIGVCIGLALPV